MSDRFTIGVKVRGLGVALAVVRELRDVRPPATAEKLEQFETDVLAGFVLARASAGLADGVIRGDIGHLEQMRSWFGRPPWEMEPPDADTYVGRVLRASPSGTRLGRAQALTTYFLFLELRHKVEIHRMTGRVIECPIDEIIEDVWGQFDDDHTRPGAPLFPSERRCADGSSGRVGDDAPRGGLKAAATTHLPG
ncbi:hypothetical protein [Streptomyces sp. NPDC007369]|uniref:hypothetical protein n=1 Tax=Streptomyces sp. NPDC007369 TaxID=3154589 RepID=UPI0033FBCCA2